MDIDDSKMVEIVCKMRPGLSRVSEKKIKYNGYPLTQT